MVLMTDGARTPARPPGGWHEPRGFPLELLLRVITVSLETMKIVNGLPKLDIDAPVG